VLVVDDEPAVRELLVEYFRERGHEVTALASGTDAIDELEQRASVYSLIVSDLQLPGTDGLDVLKHARALNPAATVIIVTGYASLESAVQAVRLGAYDYLTKPFSLGQLDVIVRRAAERQALEAENRQLARQIEGHAPASRAPLIADRLDAIDLRLARIERLLRGVAEPPRG
jgi:DNA-binding NtrC family response regulator